MKDSTRLTPAEFEVLEVLWREDAPLSVGDVLADIQRRRAVAYTTVMTVLDKLARKGSVGRAKKGKAYFYTPRVRREDVLRCVLDEFTDHYFEGSRRRLREFLRGGPGEDGGLPRSNGSEAESLDVSLL